jgi:hypothetical protein
MLAAERQCSRNPHQRQYWSPTQRKISRTYSYWKQKANMATKKLFLWNHLNQLCKDTDITEQEHAIIDISIINKNKKETRAKWCSCKKLSIEIRKKFLRERALFMASKMRSTEKKALKAISKAEESRTVYRNIRELLGKPKTIFTQVATSQLTPCPWAQDLLP